MNYLKLLHVSGF